MLIKSEEEIEILREAGKRLANVLQEVIDTVQPGISVRELDSVAENGIRAGGDIPAFLGYQPDGASRPFPATLCVSVNEEIVHGIPTENPRTLQEGDIVGVDIGLKHKGLFVDMARTVPVGKITPDVEKLLAVTKEALARGIRAARPGGHIGDIGHAIETFVTPHGYGTVSVLGGHGVGHAVHEDPYIPNFGRKGEGPEIKPGMVLALEPMLNIGGEDVQLQPDGYTFTTKDGSLSAHFEDTIVVTQNGPEVLTQL